MADDGQAERETWKMKSELLRGRIAIVTGASRGIGAAIAKSLARNGAMVVVNYLRSHDAAESVVAEIKERGGQAIVVQADASDNGAVDQMLGAVKRSFGTPDTLVLNADAGLFRPTPISQQDCSTYEARLLSEMKLAIIPTKAVLPDMIAMKRGSIIAVSSALCRTPVPGFSTLSVSKAALESFIRALAAEVGPLGVRVNAVEASLIETENSEVVPDRQREELINWIPQRRFGKPDDVAGAVTFLASDLSSFVNGATVPVNGGQLMY